MALTRLTLRQFRNHDATRLDGLARFNVLVGENGAGKTNVLEAISLLAPGRGLRRAQPADMAARGAMAALPWPPNSKTARSCWPRIPSRARRVAASCGSTARKGLPRGWPSGSRSPG
jgi:ABC-type Mn2+/Zn2+ transport system ATPase subunit